MPTGVWAAAFSSKSAYELYLQVEETAYSIENNTSTVAWRAWLKINDYLAFSEYATTIEVKLSTDTVFSYSGSYSAGDGRTVPYMKAIGNGTYTAPHNDEGVRWLGCSASMTVASGSHSPGSAAINQTLELTKIPRGSTVSAADGETGSPISISVKRSSTAFRHTLEYSFAGHTGTIATGVETAYTWTPETATFAPWIPNAASGQCVITCKTYNGQTLVGTATKAITLTLPASVKPTTEGAWYAVGRENQGGAAGIQKWIQGYSKLGSQFYAANITNAYGATTAYYGILVEGAETKGQAATQLSAVLTQAGETAYTVFAEDSRGRRVTASGTVTVESYSVPAITSYTVFRCNAQGVRDGDGTYVSVTANASVSSLDGANTGTLTVKARQKGGSWGSATALVSGTASILPGFLVSESYEVQITLTDTVGNAAVSEATIETAAVAFHIREGGKGAAFFTYATEDGALNVAGEIKRNGTAIWDYIYPVGSIYQSTESTDPGTLFGGTWETVTAEIAGANAWKRTE